MGVIIIENNYPISTSFYLPAIKRQTATQNVRRKENTPWKRSTRNLGKLSWEHIGKLIILGLAAQVIVCEASETSATQQSGLGTNVANQSNLLDSVKRASPKSPFSPRPECTISKEKLLELQNTINSTLSDVSTTPTDINCELNNANPDNCDELLTLIQCGVKHLKNEFIRATQNNATSEQYTELRNSYNKLYGQFQKYADEIRRQVSQKYQHKLDVLTADFQECQRKLKKLEAENRELRKILNNIPSHARLKVKELIERMSDSGPTTNGWDVLCSYDLKALNRVLLEEYQKFPVNSQLNFSLNNEVVSKNIRKELKCNLIFDNPILSFSSVTSGSYILKIPISPKSSCNQVTYYKGNIDETNTTIIPHGYNILVSGPLKTIKGKGRGALISSSNEIIEFGNSKQANIVLHFGRDINRRIQILKGDDVPSKDSLQNQGLYTLFKEIKDNFYENIQEINYNIVQVVSETAKVGGIILTPKRFIFKTMVDENNKEHGVLNIWIQTNEFPDHEVNHDPSFDVGSNLIYNPNKIYVPILPIPSTHDSAIIFSKQLMKDLYFRPALQEYFDIEFVDRDPLSSGPSKRKFVIKLIPKRDKMYEKEFKYEYIGSVCQFWFDCTSLKINYENAPFYLYMQDHITLEWLWSQDFKCSYTHQCTGPGPYGPPILSGADGEFKVELSIDQDIFQTINNHYIHNMTYSINPDDIKMNTTKIDNSKNEFLSWLNNIKSNAEFPGVVAEIHKSVKEHLSPIKIDFQSLNYFAEANILFNEERFKIANNKAVHFPGDVIIFGDIEDR